MWMAKNIKQHIFFVTRVEMTLSQITIPENWHKSPLKFAKLSESNKIVGFAKKFRCGYSDLNKTNI